VLMTSGHCNSSFLPSLQGVLTFLLPSVFCLLCFWFHFCERDSYVAQPIHNSTSLVLGLQGDATMPGSPVFAHHHRSTEPTPANTPPLASFLGASFTWNAWSLSQEAPVSGPRYMEEAGGTRINPCREAQGAGSV
jgi:hypothetical protein